MPNVLLVTPVTPSADAGILAAEGDDESELMSGRNHCREGQWEEDVYHRVETKAVVTLLMFEWGSV